MKIVYVSYLNSDYSRSSVHLNFLSRSEMWRSNIEFVKIPSGLTPKIRPLFSLLRFRKINPVFVVMSPASSLVIYLRILGFRRIILDGGWPMLDAAKIRARSVTSQCATTFLDFLSIHLSKKYACETEEQLRNIQDLFRIQSEKLTVSYTGFDELQISKSNSINTRKFTGLPTQGYVFFRGKPNDEAGIETIVEAAGLIGRKVEFVIASPGFIKNDKLGQNIYLLNQYLDWSDISRLYRNAILVLGQMSNNERLKRTIPHKFFEAAYFGKAYLTAFAPPLRNIMGDDLLECEGDNANVLAETIEELIKYPARLQRAEKMLKRVYDKRLSQKIISEHFLDIVKSV